MAKDPSKTDWFDPALPTNKGKVAKAFASPTPYEKTIEVTLGLPRAAITDFRNLIGSSPARIALFEFLDPVQTTGTDEEILEAIWENRSRCVEANATFCRAFGFANTDDAIGLSLSQFYPRTEINRELFRQWIENGFFLARFNASGKNSAGFSISLQHSVYSDFQDNEIGKIWIVSRDISDLMSALSAAKREEEHYRTMVERPGLVLVRARPDGSYTYITPHVEDIVGYTVQDFFNEPRLFRSLLHPDDQEKHDAIYQARGSRSAKPVELEFRVLCKDGTYHWFFERMTPKFDRNGRVEFFDSIAFDIQERKQLEAELMHAQRMEIVGTLAGGIAHDFNNHLTGILGQITLCLSELPDDHPSKQRLVSAEQAALCCSEMTKHLLGLGRKVDSQLSSVDVDQVVRQTVDLLRHVLPSSIRVTWTNPGNLPPILGNPAQLQQVIMNLAVNSRDAMPSGGDLSITGDTITLEKAKVTADGRTLPPGNYVRICVRDTGAGISENVLPHIFEPFFTTKAPGQGTGLGLSSVYSIVSLWHGDIVAGSDAGAIFTLHLPVSDTLPEKSEGPPNVQLGARGEETILIVDDDPLVRSVLTSALTLKGYRVVEAGSGDDALKLSNIPGCSPAAAIIDRTMPGLSGAKLAARLKGDHPEIKIIISSGYGREQYRDPNESGMHFLPKPFGIPELYRTVRETLDDVRSTPDGLTQPRFTSTQSK